MTEYKEVSLTKPQVKIRIMTEPDYFATTMALRGIAGFTTLLYRDGGFSNIPDDMFESWRNYCKEPGTLYLGRCSSFGVGSSIRFTSPDQNVRVGRYVSCGIETRFMSSGFHETRTISTCEFGSYEDSMNHAAQREYGDIILKNDIWLGDECMIMAGTVIENGCIIGARSLLPLNFKSEPYGIYAGNPAKLKKYRFTEKIREALVDLAWWDMPFAWIKENKDWFILNLTMDEGESLEMLKELKLNKESYAG